MSLLSALFRGIANLLLPILARAAEDEVFLSQDTGWGWLRKIGASSTAGQQRLRLRRGYEQPGSKAREQVPTAHTRRSSLAPSSLRFVASRIAGLLRAQCVPAPSTAGAAGEGG